MAEKRPLTFAGDESGDVSFTFDKGASRYFVVAFIGATQPDELRNALVKLRMARNLPAGYEFEFHRLSSRRLRAALWAALRPLDFQVWALVVDKRRLPDTIRQGTLFELKRTLNVRSIRYRFKSIKPVRSRSEDLVQVADLAAGAIHRRFSKGASDSYHELKGRLLPCGNTDRGAKKLPWLAPVHHTAAGRHSRRLFARGQKPCDFVLSIQIIRGV